MQLSDFSFSLPDELIAQYPLPDRSASRLMCLDGATGSVTHSHFEGLLDELKAGDRLVLNDTRVIAARLFGRKSSGGKVEIMLERLISEHSALVKIRSSKSPKAGSRILLDDDISVEVVGRHDDLFEITVSSGPALKSILDSHGSLPLPPYIDRAVEAADATRYQTVYAKHDGAVAAPTAGLHFTEEMLSRIVAIGVDLSYVTLHVGAGTFQPVRSPNLDDHIMHAERASLQQDAVDAINGTRAAGGRVIAVGTTSVRVLESAASSGKLKVLDDETRLFIRPGDAFNVVDGMITNFHLPESTLLMLVCAFAGTENILSAYNAAVKERYRFFSYGDAMLLWPSRNTGKKTG